MDSINFVNLKSDQSDGVRSQSNPANSLDQNETTFITANPSVEQSADQIWAKKVGQSVLLKHNVSSRRLSDSQSLQKSKSAPYLLPIDTQESTDGKSSPNGLYNNNFLASTPNLFNSNNLFGNYDNILKLLQTPNSKLHQLIDGDPQTPRQIKSVDNQTSAASSSSGGLPPAILCRNVSFDYRQRKVNQCSNVLRNVNLRCPIGSIYGLLGPSGCGKTTLIKLILGTTYKPISGDIKAFGYDVYRKDSGMMGSGVGYQPQSQSALIFDFTIEEHLTYFGRLYYMPYEKIRREVDYLIRMLDLPEKTRLVHQLSGGQQHRVSFACALIHKPRLLILDEPTVGLDPILRERIWLQMISLVERHKTTILITTHYIEEAKRANLIGFLRKGQLLVENTPQFLMKKYETSSLERIFFKLCIEQAESKKAQDKLSHHIDVNFNNSVNEMIEKSFVDQQQSPTTSSAASESATDDLNNGGSSSSLANSSIAGQNEELFKIPWIDPNHRNPVSKWLIQFFAIVIKHFILTSRRPETVLAQYVLPLIAIGTFCVCIGSTPTGIRVAVINEETCGFPIDQYAHLKRHPLNTVDDVIKKFESFFWSEDGNEANAKREKRSVELTTLNWDIFGDEDEVTTSYPSRFNLMNNLNFNENRDLRESEPGYTKHDLATTTQSASTASRNFPASASSTVKPVEEHHLDPATDSPIVLVDSEGEEDEPPVPKPVLSNEHPPSDLSWGEPSNSSNWNSDDHSWGEPSNGNFSDWNSNDKLPAAIDTDEENVTEADDELRSHLVNSQFEDACFSQMLIRKMNDFIFDKIPYASYKQALEDVRLGKIWGVIRIKKGFSRALVSKLLFMDYGDVNITDSLVDINADLTNRALIITLEVTLSRLYPDFVRDVLSKANEINMQLNSNSSDNETHHKLYNINSGRLPIVLGQHVFKPKFTLSDFFGIREFAAPGILIILTYSVSYALTVFSLVGEISDKVFDRHQCIGLTSNQLIFSHLFTRFIFSATGTIFVMLVSVYVFEVSNHGSFLNATILLLLQSYCAMTHGMVISALSSSLFITAAISNGFLFFIFIISGVLWSFETMPPLMKSIGVFMPSTIPCESLRTIMTRGQGFESNTVIYGYLITVAWIIIHYMATILIFNYRKQTK